MDIEHAMTVERADSAEKKCDIARSEPGTGAQIKGKLARWRRMAANEERAKKLRDSP